MLKKALVYQAYGIDEIMRQTQVSIVSLLKVISDESALDILIYTDNKNYFSEFFKKHPSIQIIEINKEQIRKWRGEIDFVHRVKIEILIDAAKRTEGALYYSDGDTYFLKCPLKLFDEVNDRVSVMHVAESILEDANDPLTKKIYKFTKKHHFHVGINDAMAIGSSTTMWNAGFIGISHKNKELLPQILQLTDQMHSLYQKHVMEQLAFSYILQINGEIRPANQEILHYWDQKPDYQLEIDRFLKEHSDSKVAVSHFDQFIRPKKVVQKKKKTFWSFFRK